MRIREGDPLEIYTDTDGQVIFKKYSPMGELSEFAAQICDALHKTTGGIAAVCDRDAVIAVAGGGKRELLDRRISRELEELMSTRGQYAADSCTLPVVDTDERTPSPSPRPSSPRATCSAACCSWPRTATALPARRSASSRRLCRASSASRWRAERAEQKKASERMRALTLF